MVFSLEFILNHALDGNSPCTGQMLSNTNTVYTQIENTKRQEAHWPHRLPEKTVQIIKQI